jgi:hypothetical protein
MCLYPACRYEAVVRRPGRLLFENLLCRFHALYKHARNYVKNSDKYKALLEDWGFASETLVRLAAREAGTLSVSTKQALLVTLLTHVTLY